MVEDTLWSDLQALPYKLVAFSKVVVEVTSLIGNRVGLMTAVMHLYFYVALPCVFVCGQYLQSVPCK